MGQAEHKWCSSNPHRTLTPSAKNASSLSLVALPSSALKKASLTDSGTLTADTSTVLEVAMTYAWFTRRRGTPLTL